MRKLVVAGLLLAGVAGYGAGFRLSENGRVEHVIVVPDDAAPVIRNAAQELSDHLSQVTGGTFEIVEEGKRPAGRPGLYVGNCVASKDVFKDVSFSELGFDTTAIRFVGRDLFFDGQGTRGALYAVYVFLEDYVGVRWWTQTESFIPKKPTLDVEAKDYLYTPKIRSRETFYTGALDGRFAPRLRANGHFARISPEWGGHMSIIGWCHTFYQFLPPGKYFDAHPEWYSEIGGVRSHNHRQLCLTNEEMRKEFVKVCLERIGKNPSAGMISVSQNDWHGRCECKACLAVEAEEESQSGPLIRFVNAVAAEIGKEYPDFLIETLAYQYTRKAPKKVRPAKNVVIRLCSIEMNFAQPLETGPANASFKKDIEDWSAISPNLYIWNYVTNFANYMLPQPNWRGLAPDIRFFVKHNAVGIFEQGDAGSTLGDFVRARQWLVAHLLWNPDLDERALLKDFLDGYYGAAGPHLLAYIDFLCDCVEKSGYNLRCYNSTTDGWLTYPQLNEALALYKKAEQAVAGDAVLAARVRRERLSLDLVCLQEAPMLMKWKIHAGKSDVPLLPEPEALADEFDKLCTELGIGQIREGVAYGDYGKNLKKNLVGSIESVKNPPEWCKGLAPDRWVFFTPGYFSLHRPGSWVSIVEDAEAYSGTAARMPSDTNQWATQIPFGGYYGLGKKWKAVYRVRCDAETDDGDAMNFGIWCNALGRNLVQRRLKASEIRGKKYVTFETEPFELQRDQYIWFAPVIRKLDEVSAVYVDCVTMLLVD